MGSHAAVAAQLLGDREMVSAALADPRAAPITPRLRAILLFAQKMARDAQALGPADVAEAKSAGVTEDELYDATLVCALFQFYNAWVDANGVENMSDEAYAATAVRLARDGYSPK